MGQIRKVGDLYYIEFNARGLTYSQVAGSTPEEAQRMLDQVESTIAQGESLTVAREIELKDFIGRFHAYAAQRFSSKSLKRLMLAWDDWMIFLARNYSSIQRLSQITPSVLESYKANLITQAKPKTVNLTILLLREIFEYGIRIGFINDNPSLHLSLMPVTAAKIKESSRTTLAKDLLGRHVSLEKICSILKLSDIAQIIYWSNFIPLKREDVYN